MALFGSSSGLYGGGGGLYGGGGGLYPQRRASGMSGITPEEWVALQQFLKEEEERERGSGGGFGNWIRETVEGGLTHTGLDKIPYVSRAGGQIAESLIWGIPGMVGGYVGGNLKDIVGSDNDSFLEVLESVGLSGASLGGLLPTAGLYREATGDDSALRPLVTGMAQGIQEDVKHPLRNIGYLSMDIAGAATLAKGGFLRGRTGLQRARGAAGAGPLVPEAPRPSSTPMATEPRAETIRVPEEVQGVREKMAAAQSEQQAAIDNQRLAAQMQEAEALRPSAIPQLEEVAQLASMDMNGAVANLLQQAGPQPLGLPRPPRRYAAFERAPTGIPAYGQTEILNFRRPPEPGATALLEPPPPAPTRPASGLIEADEPASRIKPAAKPEPEPATGPELEFAPAQTRGPKAGDPVERMLADVGELEHIVPEGVGPATPLDWAIQLVTKKFGMQQRRGMSGEESLQLTMDLIENERRRAMGEELLPVKYPDFTDPSLDLGSYLKGKAAREDELARTFQADKARQINEKLDRIGGYLVSARDVARLSKRKKVSPKKFVPRRREGTGPMDEDYVMHRGGEPTRYGWKLVSYGPGEQPRPIYKVTDSGLPIGPDIMELGTANNMARAYAADVESGVPSGLRELDRGSGQLVRLGKKAAEELGQDYVPLERALEHAEGKIQEAQVSSRGRKKAEREEAALIEEAAATGVTAEELAAQRLSPEQQAERQRYLKETEGEAVAPEVTGMAPQDVSLARLATDEALERTIARREKVDALQQDLANRDTILGVEVPKSALSQDEFVQLKQEAPPEMKGFLDMLEETSQISPEVREVGAAADVYRGFLQQVFDADAAMQDVPRKVVAELTDEAYGPEVSAAAKAYQKAVGARKATRVTEEGGTRISTRRLKAALERAMNLGRREAIEGSLTDIPAAAKGLTTAISELEQASAGMFRQGAVGRMVRQEREPRVPREERVAPEPPAVELEKPKTVSAEETPQTRKRAPRGGEAALGRSVRLRDIRRVAPGLAEAEQRSIGQQIRNGLDRRSAAGEAITDDTLVAEARAAGLDEAAANALIEKAASEATIKFRRGSVASLLKDSGLSEEHIAMVNEDLTELRATAKAEGRELTKNDYRKLLDDLDPEYGAGTGDRVFNALYEYADSPNKLASLVIPVLVSLGIGGPKAGAVAGFVGMAGHMRGRPIVPRSGPPSFGHLAAEYLRGFVGPQPGPGFTEFTRLTEGGDRIWEATQPRSPSIFGTVQEGWHRFLQHAADDVMRTELELQPRSRAHNKMGNYIWEKKVDYYKRMRERLMAPARLQAQQLIWDAEIDRVDAFIDDLNLTPDQKYKLRTEYAEEFGESPMARHAAAQAVPAEVGILGKTMDTANQIASLLLLYLKPGYIPPNFMGQVLFTTIDHAWNPISMGRAFGITQELRKNYPEFDEMAQKLAQAGPMEILKTERGWWRGLQGAHERLSDLYGSIIDDPNWAPFRRLAITNELVRRGYRTADQQARVYESIHELGRMDAMTEAERWDVSKRYTDLEHAVMEGNRNIVDYGNLGAQEKRVIRRAVLFYPWVKGATKYAGRFLLNHPVQAAIMAQLGKEAQDEVGRVIGAVPSYLEGVIPMPKWVDKVPLLSDIVGPSSRMVPGVGEVPRFINPAAMTPLGTGGEMINMAKSLAFGGVRQVERPGGLLTPALSALTAATLRVDPFFGGAVSPETSFGDILLQEAAQINLPGQAFATGLGVLAGKTPEEIGIPFAGTLTPQPKSRRLETGELGVEETLLPTTPQEEIGRFLVGGVYPSSVNPQVSRERAAAEAYSMMGDVDQAKAKWKDKIMLATQAAREKGAIGPRGQLPKELRDAVQLKLERDVNYATYADETGQSEDDLDEFEKLDADVRLAVRKRFFSLKEALKMRDEYAAAGMADQLRSLLARNYFGDYVISAYSDYYSLRYPGLELDFSLR